MKYYFDKHDTCTISEGYTTITIIDHVAEVANNDPDTVLVARKNGGAPQSRKWEDRFRPPHIEHIQPLEVPLDIDSLFSFIHDFLLAFPNLSFSDESNVGLTVFNLHCRRWGNLGTLRLAERGDVTYLIFSLLPHPTGDELEPVRMLGDSAIFRHGKQKRRNEIVSGLFEKLAQHLVWINTIFGAN